MPVEPGERRLWPLLALALLAGVLQAVSIAAFWDGQPKWWLQLLSMAGFVALLDQAGSHARRDTTSKLDFSKSAHGRAGTGWRRSALIGWTFTVGWLAASYWWMTISMHRYGGMPLPLAWGGVIALAMLLALYYAVMCGIFERIVPKAQIPSSLRAIVFASLWLLAELMRGVWFTGLPWGAAGYAHIDGPLSGLAPWAGVYAMTTTAALLAAWLGLGGGRQVVRIVVVLGLLLGATLLPQQTFTTSAGTLNVSLLQGNIAQSEKFERSSGIPQALAWYAEQLNASTADLVVTPETAVPLLPRYLPPGYLEQIERRFSTGEQAALVGIPLVSPRSDSGYTNSALGFAPGAANVYRYDKHHLVPFGEFVPPLFKWFVDQMHIPLGDFDRGGVGQPSFAHRGQRFAPNICYEDLFGEELGQRFADPALAPTLFVNISNMAWFGDTLALDQHLQMSRLRALEFQRPVVRATNTGATAFIDAQGRVLQQLPRFTQGVLTASVDGRRGNTPYATWVSRWWLWPFWLVALGVPLLAWALLRMRQLRPAAQLPR
ncbi:MAG: apolipoprotein N-acyltransferase [Burkholderiaceae bacterium]